MADREIRVSKFNQTCTFFYQLSSVRVEERYKLWKQAQPFGRGSMKDIYSDNKILGQVMSYHKKQKIVWSYASFIPYGLENALTEIGMNKYELYWGLNPSLYFEEFFVTFFMEMISYDDYKKCLFLNYPTDEIEIRNFYHQNKTIILEPIPWNLAKELRRYCRSKEN